MVSKKQIESTLNKIINNNSHKNIIIKTHYTVNEMHIILGGYSKREKETLLQYTYEDFNINEYHNLLENGSEDEIFNYEREILDKFKDRRRNNILTYLNNFNENDFGMDDDVGYPNDERGDLEYQQEQYQEKQGYTDELKDAVEGWTGGWFEEMNQYILTGDKELGWGERFDNIIKNRANTLQEYIQESKGLTVNTLLFRGGHWDEGTKVGDVKTIPLFNSTSYSRDSAEDIGIEQSDNPESKYMINVYAPKGTKGCMINAPSLSKNFPEHEYLLGKGQKYIVLDVDDDSHTASILLIND